MAYYYVINTGTLAASADTPYSTKQTGAFPANANCYASIGDALSVTKTTDPTHGDFVCVADTHDHTYSVNAAIAGPYSAGVGVTVLSVSATNCDQYSTGAKEDGGTASDITVSGVITVKGMDWTVGDDFWIASNETNATLVDCTINAPGSQDKSLGCSGNSVLVAINCTFTTGGTLSTWPFNNDTMQEFYGCTFNNALTANPPFILSGSGPVSTKFVGCDLSNIGSAYLFDDIGFDGISDGFNILNVMSCKLPASFTDYASGSVARRGTLITIAGCGSTSSEAEYQYHHMSVGGRVDDETGIYRDNSTAFPSGQKSSLKVASTTAAGIATPFMFDFPTRFADLSLSGTLRIYLQSNTQLYDSDVWAEVIYADGTNGHQANYLSTRHDNLLDTNGTELFTNTQSWSGTAQTYQYHIDLDTATADPGGKGYPTVRVFVAKASATIYFDSEVVLA